MGLTSPRVRSALSVQSANVGAVTSTWLEDFDDPGNCRICDELTYKGERYSKTLCLECGPAVAQARRFRLSLPRVNAILRIQNDYCAICGNSPGDRAAEGPIWWQIDHDHKCCTGCPRCVRGLLCLPCNVRLGHYEGQLRRGRLDGWRVQNVDDYLASPPAQSADARKLHPDDYGWARVRYTALTWRILTWKESD
ncbi:endonuclease domain-containing protein [Streptomyces sp. NPDC091278]|uniref:endonuclease domain-containing protein n=1 Tax=Streptomyces sp. NPDC091278 TaxID=3155301 RepID=UPI00344F57B5